MTARRIMGTEVEYGISVPGDPTANPEERSERRRRLTKGPPEFQMVRVDRLKAKSK